ncbi:putative sanpodo [Operophtera brumata]|uniref:Putative sanpodo n=1 Tax=Operophtera brumata TaxID=104452 RepID=A0A0L7L4Z0_OPEBR|nr:putative sanpodo [Operophtera brumata]
MDSPKIVYKYYSNPAFCGQSEGYKGKLISPDRQRMTPLGANSPRKIETFNTRILRTDISDNPLRMSPAARMRDEPPELPPKPAKFQRQFQRQTSLVYKQTRQVRSRTRSEDLEMAQFQKKRYDRNADSDDGLEDRRRELEDRRHRYEIIQDMDDLADYSPTKKRIVQADASEIEEYNVDRPDENEMKEIPSEIVKTVNGKTLRYAIVPLEDDEPVRRNNVTFSSPMMSQKNLIATQKLHELLSTPRKLKSYASQPSVRITPNKDSPRFVSSPPKVLSSTPSHGITPSKSCANLAMHRLATSPISPKAQQKLSYGLPDFERDVFVTSPRESFDLERDGSYIVLSTFSLLCAFGLLILLTVQPEAGTALNDITSGAVCGVSILSLWLASAGVLTSYCCARDPPDNRTLYVASAFCSFVMRQQACCRHITVLGTRLTIR